MTLLLILLLLALIWLFLAMPHMPRRPLGKLADYDYAHRGLWNDERPENSLSAFKAAVQHGFGIELDVHLTQDGRLVVFHDSSLKRICGCEGKISNMTLEALRECRLNGTDEHIPTFEEALACVNGKTPLIVELKHGPRNDELCQKVYEALKRYGHADMWCIESFHPLCVRWFRKHAPQVIRGQLAYGLRTQQPRRALDIFVASLIFNALSRPDFVAYRAADEPSLPMKWVRVCCPSLVAWTVKSQQQMDALRGRYHMQIFEGFVPKH